MGLYLGLNLFTNNVHHYNIVCIRDGARARERELGRVNYVIVMLKLSVNKLKPKYTDQRLLYIIGWGNILETII